jgi:rRNA maturation endonuclease Nob1
MNEILGLLMVGIAALWVAMPFFGQEAQEDLPAPEPVADRDKFERQKREAYAAIKEAELDHQMGKLSEADFALLTDKYRQQARAAIAALESPQRADDEVAARLPARIAYCATCGQKLPSKANFCPACGRAVRDDREALGQSAGLSEATA